MRKRTAIAPTALLLSAAGCVDYNVHIQQGVDIFYQVPPATVDILMVVDNSGSMADYQAKVGALFSEFVEFPNAAEMDYQIGVVTTTVPPEEVVPEWGCTPPVIAEEPEPGNLVDGVIITPETADPAGSFDSLINVGICGSSDEMGLEAARLALTEPLVSTVNAGFLREEASLSLVFLSDDDDDSPYSVYEYANSFSTLKGETVRDAFNISAFVIQDYTACEGYQDGVYGASSIGQRYAYLAETTGGAIGELCADDYTDTMLDLSLAIARLKEDFRLSDIPAPATLEVTVNDEVIPCDDDEWSYSLLEDEDGTPYAQVSFDRKHLPPVEAKITIRYNYGQGDPADFCPDEAAR